MTLTVQFNLDDSSGQQHFEKVAAALRRSRRCVVVTGAGISVAGGIPVSISTHSCNTMGLNRRRTRDCFLMEKLMREALSVLRKCGGKLGEKISPSISKLPRLIHFTLFLQLLRTSGQQTGFTTSSKTSTQQLLPKAKIYSMPIFSRILPLRAPSTPLWRNLDH